MVETEFEWDDAKAAANFVKHGVPLAFGALVFLDGNRLELDATRAEEAEEHRKVIGFVNGLLFVAVYTTRCRAVRLISVRRANAKEGRIYGKPA